MKVAIVGRPVEKQEGYDLDVDCGHGAVLEFTIEDDGEVRFWALNIEGTRYVGDKGKGKRISPDSEVAQLLQREVGV